MNDSQRPPEPNQPSQPAWIRPDTGFSTSGYPGSTHPAPTRPTDTRPQPGPEAGRRRPTWAALLGTSLAAALLASGVTLGAGHLIEPTTQQTASPGVSTTTSADTSTNARAASSGALPNWEAVASEVKDSVVSISMRTADGSGNGSGVILDNTGHILTNNHVIDGAREIVVTLADGRMLKAKVRGTDPATDLAVLTLDDPPSDLKPATFGDSSGLTVGQPVVAVGNPLGLSSTVTTGIVSALNRPVTTSKVSQDGPFEQVVDRVTTNAIQIDASINPGNSGGPIFDGTGKVIGISSSIATLGQQGKAGSIGLGFAIPANLASRVADQLIANGVAEHAFLGVGLATGQAATDSAVRAGAQVRSVEDGSPAGKAGIQVGDVIVAIDKNAVQSADSLVGYVRQYASGDTVTVSVVRGGQTKDIEVTLAARQDQPQR